MFKRLIRWGKPWLLSATLGLVVFGLLHQVLVAPTLAVFMGVPAAVVLSIPIIAAYAALRRAGVEPSGPTFGLMVFAGFVPHYALITVAMWDRTFDDGPRGGWLLLALASAPAVSGSLCWLRCRSARATVLLVLGTLILTFGISGFQESEPDARNLGAFISLLPACLGAGWILARTAPKRARAGVPTSRRSAAS